MFDKFNYNIGIHFSSCSFLFLLPQDGRFLNTVLRVIKLVVIQYLLCIGALRYQDLVML